jgi:protein TonB
MHRSLHFTPYVAASFGLHVLFAAVLLLLAPHAAPPLKVVPVNIIEVPKELLRKLPPLSRPEPAPAPPVPAVPHGRAIGPEPRTVPQPHAVPPAVSVPRTAPAKGTPEGSEQGKGTAGQSPLGTKEAGKGPLPFLSQADIDELAKKGMPDARPGDNSVTLDTDEFKFMSYNRWLKIKIESVLKYPELAALSRIQGTLYIKFDILKDGSLGGLELLKSSGYKILDDEALRAIQSSAPFQPLPEDWHMERYPIRAAVLFYLNEAYIR